MEAMMVLTCVALPVPKTVRTPKTEKRAASQCHFLERPFFDVIHRAADPIAVFVFFSEMNCKGDFGKFGAHAKQCRDPHPEDRSGTADGDGAGDAGNITRAYSSSQSGAQRLERRRGAISRFFFVQRSANGVFSEHSRIFAVG